MRVSTTIYLAYLEREDDQDSDPSSFADSQCVDEPVREFVSLYHGKNRVIVIEQSEE